MAKYSAFVCLQGHADKIGHQFILQQFWIWHGVSGSFFIIHYLIGYISWVKKNFVQFCTHGSSYCCTQFWNDTMFKTVYDCMKIQHTSIDETLVKVVVCWWALRGKSLNSMHITYPSQRVGEGHSSYRNVHLYMYMCDHLCGQSNKCFHSGHKDKAPHSYVYESISGKQIIWIESQK